MQGVCPTSVVHFFDVVQTFWRQLIRLALRVKQPWGFISVLTLNSDDACSLGLFLFDIPERGGTVTFPSPKSMIAPNAPFGWTYG